MLWRGMRRQTGQVSASSAWWRVHRNVQLRRQASCQRPSVSARQRGQKRDPRARPHSVRVWASRCVVSISTTWPLQRSSVICASRWGVVPVACASDAASWGRSRTVHLGVSRVVFPAAWRGRPTALVRSASPTLKRAASASSHESSASPSSGSTRIGKERTTLVTPPPLPGRMRGGSSTAHPAAPSAVRGGLFRRLRRS